MPSLRRSLSLFWTIAPLLCASSAMSAEDIRVIGLFTGKAVLQIEGERRVMAVGETSPEGYTLIDSNSNAATLRIHGKSQVFTLGSQNSLKFAAPTETTLRLQADRAGMYPVNGTINGEPINFLVDTGATLVSLNSKQAGRLGIDFKRVGKQTQMSTASGVDTAFMVTLAAVRVGEIELKNIQAVVSPGDYPEVALLGMAFLSKLEVSHSANVMTLKKK